MENLRLRPQYRVYREEMPEILRGRSRYLMDKCKKLVKPDNLIDKANISVDGRLYLVNSASRDVSYKVSIHSKLCCECPYFENCHLPCKHILAVMIHYKIKWEELPPVYSMNPVFNLDKDYSFSSGTAPLVASDVIAADHSIQRVVGEEWPLQSEESALQPESSALQPESWALQQESCVSQLESSVPQPESSLHEEESCLSQPKDYVPLSQNDIICKIKHIETLAYNCDKEDTLRQVMEHLMKAESILQHGQDRSNGLSMELPKKRKRMIRGNHPF